MEGAGIVSDSADRHVIKEHVASQRQQASVLATNARDVQDMIFIAHSETVTCCVSPWEAVCVASPCGRLVLQALVLQAWCCRRLEPLFIHTLRF